MLTFCLLHGHKNSPGEEIYAVLISHILGWHILILFTPIQNKKVKLKSEEVKEKENSVLAYLVGKKKIFPPFSDHYLRFRLPNEG